LFEKGKASLAIPTVASLNGDFSYFAYFLLSLPVEVEYWNFCWLIICIQKLLRFVFVPQKDKHCRSERCCWYIGIAEAHCEQEVFIRGGQEEDGPTVLEEGKKTG
jgi:hypothetical protein